MNQKFTRSQTNAFSSKVPTLLMFVVVMLMQFVGSAQVAIQTFNSTYTAASNGSTYTANGAQNSSFESNNYTYNFGTNSGSSNNILNFSSFGIGSNTYAYRNIPNAFVKIRRNNNSLVSGIRQLLWYQATSESISNPLNLRQSYQESMEIMFNGSRGLNAGTDNIFNNSSDGNGNNNNIERFDYIIPDGYTIVANSQEGFIVMDRGVLNAHDPFCVAVVKSLDGSQNPSSYTSVIWVNSSNYGSVNPISVMSSFVLRKDPSDSKLEVSASTAADQGVGGVFIRYSDLGLANGTVIYGYSVLGGDFPSGSSGSKVVDWTNTTYFPTNTEPANGGLDMLAVSGIFQLSNALAPLANDVTRAPVCNLNGTGQVTVPALSATDLNSGGAISSFKILSLPSASQGVLYYHNGSSYVPASVGLVLTISQSTSLKFDPADGFSGDAVFEYLATNNFGLLSNTAYGTIPCSILPVVSAGANTSVCIGSSKVLTATGAASYTWSPSSGLSCTTCATVTANPTSIKTYTITGTNPGSCTSTGTITVSVNPLPVISAGSNVSICKFASTTLNATGGVSYTWAPSNGLSCTNCASPVASPTTTTTYTVTGTNSNGCVNTSTVTVSVNALPTISGGSNIIKCLGTAGTLTASGGVSYTWSPATGLSCTNCTSTSATPGATTTYTVTGTGANGCTNTATVTVSINPLPAISGGSSVAVCAGTATLLSATNGTSYTWSPGSGLTCTNCASPTANPTTTTTYTVTGTNSNGCVNTATVTITVNPLPVVSGGSSVAICNGSSTTLNASGAATYSWSPSSGLSCTNCASPVANPTTTKTYAVTGISASGCSGSASVTVSVNSLPSVTVSSNVTICSGASTTLTASGAASYSWTPATDLSCTTCASVVADPTVTTTYTVTGTNANGCSKTASVVVSVNPVPTVSAGSGSTICRGSSTVLSGSGATTYSWSPATALSCATCASPVASPTVTTTYTLTGTNAQGCAKTATVVVSVNATPSVSAGSGVAICAGQSTSLNASGAVSYTWLPNSGLSCATCSNPVATPVSTTIYTVTGTNAAGCTNTATVAITVNPLPVVNGGSDIVLCVGTATLLNPTGATSYVWTPGASLTCTGCTSPTANPSVTTTYTVTGTNSNGCVNASTVTVSVNQLPAINAGTSLAICAGASTNLLATGGVSYTWSPATGLSCTNCANPTANPSTTKTYIVTGVSGAGCVNTASITVSVNVMPGAINGTASVCAGLVANLTNNTAGGNWSSTNTAVATVSATGNVAGIIAGTTTISYVLPTGCFATKVFTVNPSLAVSASATNVNCNGGNNGTIDLVVSGGTPAYSYSWSNGATTQDLSALSAGTYNVTVTDAKGCTGTASKTITQPVTLSASATTTNVNCNGGSNGTIDLSVTGGTTAYTYSWSNGATTQDLSGLGAGTYSVTVTDANGCTATTTKTITQPAILAATITGNNVICNGCSNGSASLVVSGGTSPYTYLWSNGATTQNINVLPAGTYSVTITDAKGCNVVRSVVISQPDAIVVSATSTNVNCNGGNNGTASATVTGGNAPYTYLWTNGATTQNVTGLTAGTYSVTVRDINNYPATTVVTITQPTTLTATATTGNVNCFGGSNGSIDVTVSGGTTAYTYNWNTGATTQDISGLSAGTYSVQVTDANGCTATVSKTITQPTVLSASATSTNVNCNGSSNGSINLSVSGGTTAYNYSWSNGATTQDLSGLSAGTYSVTVTDSKGCIATVTKTITQPATLAATATSTNVNCNGGSNGTIDLSVTGGTTAYTYSWSNGATTQDLSGLSAGTYSVVVTDANGCTATASKTITQPATLTATASSTNALCYGCANGTASLAVAGGTTAYTYNWSNAATTQNVTGLVAGTYSVTITDANGCSVVKTVVITQPEVFAATVANTNVNCNGGANATADLTVTGGTTPYTYSWSNGTTTQDLSGLSAGTYSVVITDANGYTLNKSVTVTQPATLTASATSTNVNCNGGSNGTIDLSVTGGTTAYTYSWSNGVTTQDLSGLSAGTYSVVVTDANGCTATASKTITQPATLTATASSTNALCYGCSNGTASLVVAGGTTPYSYNWSNSATTQNVTGLVAGTYSVTITDANGCSVVRTVVITQPSVFAATVTNTNVNCNGGANGTADLTVTGGTTPYTYSWSNGSTTQDLSGLSAGTYNVVITDANGYTLNKSVTVTQPATLAASATSTNVNCNGGSNGTIDLSVTGGTTAYTYSWSNSATTQDLSGLSAGTYSVVVTDANGCTATASKTITQPATLTATASSTNALCYGCANGTASLAVAGGTTPYSYNWSNAATTQNVTGLVAGTYSVTITDANGCSTVKTVVITQPEVFAATVTNTNVNCNGGANGTADLTVTGGTTPYTYLWSNGATTQDLSGLSAGTYSVVITDANGYTLNKSVTVTQPATLAASATSTNVNCNGGGNGTIDLSVTGGTTAYTYSWSNGATTQDLSGLSAGTYSVVVTDANGCTATASKTITQPATLTATASSTNALCYGCANGTASLAVAGGTTPYSYNWSNAATTQNVTGLVAGTYSVTITDANGCSVVKTVVITQPSVFAATVTNTNVNCNGGANGTADLTVSGGTTPYTYSWSNGATTPDLSGLSAGTYSVVITDANGYTLNKSVTVTQPATLVASATSTNVNCNGGSNGTIDLSVTGGTTAYTYNWSNSVTTQDLSGLSAGTYSVVVTDANGCTATASKTITQPATLTATASSTNALCYGCANGTANLAVAGGTTPYSYNWSNSATTQNVTGLVAGTYSVTIADANGCSVVKTVVITQPEVFAATVTNTNVNCNGGANGTADLTVTGGTTPYTYSWSNGSTTQDMSGMSAGTYSVVITDANGYTLNKSVTVTQPATLVASATSTNVNCNGGSNGTIDLSVTGGTTAYTYSWSNSATTQDLSGLSAGTYSVVVTDANGCTATASKTITQPATLTATASSTNALCFGCANGTASLAVAGGTTPYSYNWSNGATTQNVTGLVAGTYSVTITDANGCSVVKTVVITQPEVFAATVTNTNVNCNGGANGTADLTVTGGTTPYTYSWSNGSTTQDLSGLSAGTYSVVITDANGYTLNKSVTVTQPTTLAATATSTNVNCNGGSNGTIDLSVTGGTTAYTYSWSNSAATQDLSGLIAGTYSVVVTDANGCTATASKTITQPATLTATASSTNALCYGCANGTASLAVAGGTTPYSYNWSNAATTQNVTGLVAGTYSVTITDANGCSVVKTVVITQPEVFAATVTNTNVNCNGGANGTADLTVTGGTTPYTYLWSNGSTTQDLSGLSAGTYSVVITDANGYTLNKSVTVTQPATLVASATSTNVNCNGGSNGTIDLSVTGGTTAYTYSWSNGATTQDLSGLSAGTYSVVVTDANGCTATASKTITQPATLTATASSTNALCYGCANGTASLAVAGGTTPYSYNWSNAATTQNVTGLVAGTYSVTITDANGCSVVKTVVITQPEVFAATVTNTNVNCNGGANGTADLTVTGGTTPYTYLWSNGATSQDLSGLSAGTYSVVITDANGYTLNNSVTVTQPATLAASATSTNVNCNGGSNGTIDLSVSGGTTAYTYSWSNGATTQDLSGLSAGTYSVVVTDANGCTATASKTITQPATLTATASSTNALCFGCANGTATLVVAGGTTAYTYNWSNAATTQNVTGLVAGTYSVTITDANGCSVVKTVVITQPEVFAATVANTNVNCNGGANATADLTVTGGTTPYTYSWSNGATTQDLSGLSAGTYSVVITDANGYTLNKSVTVTQPATLAATATSTNVNCNGGSNGTIDLSVSGGTTAYTYSWSNSATTQDLSGLSAGAYSVVVTDANGCTATASKTITQPATLTATASSTNALCYGCANGTASLAVAGGTTPYSYNWSNAATTQNVTGLVAGTYSVTITDANGCSVVKTVVITQPEVFAATVTNTNVNCNGGANGTADLTVTGGTTPYTYSWSNGSTTQDLSGLSAGTYSVVITDANGYTLNKSVTVAQPAALAASATSTNVNCNGGSNGTIDLSVTGGTTAYTYSWSNGATTQDLSGLSAGAYSVVVTDANGCTATASKTITQPATLTATASSTNALCFGCANGTASLAVAGGTTPYSYNWSNSATTQNVTGLVAGTYSVTITDANGCSVVKTVVITQPEVFAATVTNTNVNCNGGANGTADLTVTGGTTPYTYSWSNGSTTQDLSGLSAGTYSVVITDVNGYTLNNSVTVTQPATLAASATSTNVNCNGDSNGTIDLSISGGTTAYTYSWSNGATTQDLSGLSAGTYSVVVTDANGCTATASKTITQPATLTATASSTNALCFGCANGTATLVVAGGTTAYTYNWSNGTTTQNVTGLVAGTYSVTITDANGCSVVKTVVITQPEVFAATVTNTNVNCNGGANGTADLTVTGGTTPYTYSWSNGTTTQDLSGLSAGTYSVVITDANGYTLNKSVAVTQPATLADACTGTNIGCNGANTGAINLTISGGVAPYSYSWNNGATSEDLSGLSAGVYSVVVTDANGCHLSRSYTITQPTAVVVSGTVSNVGCFGGSNGSIDLNVTGGTTPYTYVWSNGATTQDVTGLTAGTYSVTVKDGHFCTTVRTYTVDQPTPIALSATTNTVICGCLHGMGEIYLNVTGGTLPYSYLWSNGATTRDDTGLWTGTYSVLVTDANGCTATDAYSVISPVAISMFSDVTNVSCHGASNGSIAIALSGGIAPYTYSWSTGATTSSISGLAGGVYSVTYTDANGCSKTEEFTVVEPAVLSVTGTSNNVACHGAANGSVDLTVSGGTAPFTYNWSNGATSEDVSALAPGCYTVTVTDVNGCSNSHSYTITQPAPMVLAGTTNTVICGCLHGMGEIYLNVTGGAAPYSFLWSNGATTQNDTGLWTGTYTVLVTDANGCTATDAYSVISPVALGVYSTVSNVGCNGGSNGSIALAISGGIPPYTYNWNTGATTQNISGLTAGLYSVAVTDANGCTRPEVFTISEPAVLAVSATTTDVTCYGGNNGSIIATVSGGTAPYSYSWSNGASTPYVASVVAGSYSLNVTDANGCATSGSYAITQDAATMVTISGPSIVCIGSAVPFSGTPSTGTWSSSNPSKASVSAAGIVTGLSLGTTNITFTGNAGCYQVIHVTVNSAIAAITGTMNVCAGLTTALNHTIGGGVWSSANTAIATVNPSTGAVTGISAGSVLITYNSTPGCYKTANFIVKALPAPITGADTVCEGLTTMMMNSLGNAGTWSSSHPAIATILVNGKVRGMAAGTATITYRATSTACYVTKVVTVNGLPAPISNPTPFCPGTVSTLTTSPAGGVWSSSNPVVAAVDPVSGTVTAMSAGMVTSYLVVVSYTLPTGCVRSTQVTVNSQPGNILGPLTLCVGSSSPLTSGSAGCSWSSTNPSVATISSGGMVTALSIGTSTIVYTNSGGCTTTAVVTVNSTLTANTGNANVCTGMTTALANAIPGGTWSSNNLSKASVNISSGVVTGIGAGTANITYRVSAGCFSITQVTVNSIASPIAGTKTVCISSTTALTYPVAGGTWSSNNVTRATVGMSTGIVTGVSTGTATITYTIAAGCFKTAIVTVSALPTAITGTAVTCAGATINLYNATSGGTWSSGNAAIAMVAPGTGVVTGVSAGIALISYQVGSGCFATREVTVNALPGGISGSGTVCQGQTVALSSETSGGTWSSSNYSVAGIDAAGVVTGSTVGTATISYTLASGCRATKVVTVGAMPAAITGGLTACAGGTTTLASATSGGSWSSSNIGVASVDATSGAVTGVAVGTVTITYTNGAGCFNTVVLTITPTPEVTPITGESSVLCIGSSLAYTNATYGGVWSTSNTSVVTVSSTGVATGVADGTATISYSVTSSCGTSAATRTVTVLATPSAGTISGPLNVCVGSIIPLTSSVPGGVWSNGTPLVAITCPCNSGQVTGIAPGVAMISYTVTNACGTAYSTYLITVNAVPAITPGLIAPVIAAHGDAAMPYTVAGAPTHYDIVWSSTASAAGFTNISGAGLTTSPMTVTVPVTATEGTYTGTIRVSNGFCTSLSQTFGITVNPSVNIYTFAGTGINGYTGNNGAATLATMSHPYNIATDCNGNAFIADFENAVIRKVSPTGVITTIAGNGSIGNSGDGGPATAATMSHPYGLVLDAAGNVYFSDYNNHVVRKVSTSGVITRVAGNAANGFAGDGGSAIAAKLFYPSGLTIDGGGNLYIADNGNNVIRKVTPGGVISTIAGNNIPGYSGDGGAATAARLASPKGVHADGTGNIYFTDYGNQVVRKVDAAGVISTVAGNGITGYVGDGGAATAAQLNRPVGITSDGAGNIYFTEQLNHVVRKVNASGIISSVAGNATPGYSGDGGPALLAQISQPMGLSRDCAGRIYIADNANYAIRILGEYNRHPYFVEGSVQTIDVCTGATSIALNTKLAVIDYDTTQPETWTVVSAPAHGTLVAGYAAVSTGSMITPTGLSYTPAVGYTGADVFVVQVNDGIATAVTTINVTVSVPPVAGTITGATAICGTGVTHLFNTIPGGTWSTSNAAVATINSGGYVTGTGYGTATVSYTVTNACGSAVATTVVTYNPTPFAGSVIGAAKVCRGSSITYTATVPGGVWTSGNTSIATVSASGVVHGVDTGLATISYAISNACGTAYGLRDVTVEILPVVGPISGAGSVCAGASVTFTNATPHGAWYSNNTSIATVGIVNGIVTGVNAGTAIISYVHNTSCGVVTVTRSISVNPSSITAPAIAGPAVVCAGTNITLTNSLAGGTWSSTSYPVKLTVGTTSGIVTGITTGTAIVTYTVGHECGISYVTRVMTVTPQPTVAPITGTISICPGWTITAANATPGGIWSSSNNAFATVNSMGVITGVSGGMPLISYSVTNSCGTASATVLMPVGAAPDVAAVTGPSSVCVGSTVTLNNATLGGTWYTPNTTVASVNSAGIVTGVGAGTALISYSVHNGCGYSYATKTITVNPLAVVASVTGLSYVCVGADITMSNAVAGGVWSTSNSAIATVSSAGVVTGLAAGSVSISYGVTNGCGTVYATKDVNVQVIFANIYASHVSSPGASDGCALLTVIGGVAPYTYLWSNGATTQNLTGLPAGIYSVLVTDAMGDTASASVTITALEARGLAGETGDSDAALVMHGAHPNPFVSQSIIRFNLPEGKFATVDIFNAATGAKVATIFNDVINPGEEYTATINGTDLASGVYIYRISTEVKAYLGKVLLVK